MCLRAYNSVALGCMLDFLELDLIVYQLPASVYQHRIWLHDSLATVFDSDGVLPS